MSGLAGGDTVFALSSGAPPAAIAIVRVSGPDAAAAATLLAGPLPAARIATLRRFAEAGDSIDRGLLLWFPAQTSVTGEDLAEFHVHGGRAVVARLLDALGRVPGLRPAEPGEFSRRAAYNGRLSLGGAEALADLLAAETEAERRAAFAAFDGALGARFEEWRIRLLALAAEAEALIDYDEDGDVADHAGEPQLRTALGTLAADIRRSLAGPSREELREGVAVVLAGPPNSGKSSLLNAMVGREAALVTTIAGTTRDLVEVQLVIAGRRVRLIDTAGLRETGDAVEALGITRARQAAAAADLRLWLGDDAPPESMVPTLHLLPRCDLPERQSLAKRTPVSVVTGQGLADISAWIAEKLTFAPDVIGLNRRQVRAAEEVATNLEQAGSELDLLLMAEHIRTAMTALHALTGNAGIDDLLDAVFIGFCLGK